MGLTMIWLCFLAATAAAMSDLQWKAQQWEGDQSADLLRVLTSEATVEIFNEETSFQAECMNKSGNFSTAHLGNLHDKQLITDTDVLFAIETSRWMAGADPSKMDRQEASDSEPLQADAVFSANTSQEMAEVDPALLAELDFSRETARLMAANDPALPDDAAFARETSQQMMRADPAMPDDLSFALETARLMAKADPSLAL